MKIRIFGKLTDIFENTEYEIDTESIWTASALRLRLEELHPQLKGMTYIIVADGKIIENETEISEDSEVALLPPYSAG